MSILVVDDDPSVRMMLEAVLEDEGQVGIRGAESAMDAFEQLGMNGSDDADVEVDLVLMDISMPGIDGVEACRRIKSQPHLRDIPIIMVTGLADTQDLESAFAAGAVDYITKPPKRGEMMARVRSALDLKLEMDRRKASYVLDLEQKNQELQQAFAELELKNQQLEEASLAKTQILGTATHELRTPLTSIVGYVDRMLLRRDSVGPLNEKQEGYLEKVQNNAHRLKRLVDDLLDISRIESGGLDLVLLDLDVAHEVEEVVGEMQTQISEKQLDLYLNFPTDLPRIQADRLRFVQVITNLLSNSCKYSPAGASVTVTVSELDEFLQIDVADTGIGISQDDIPKLFSKFFRTDNSSTRKVSGTGLGLYITKKLVEAHGGQIWAESVLGEGTTFKLTWPCFDPEPASPAEIASKTAS